MIESSQTFIIQTTGAVRETTAAELRRDFLSFRWQKKENRVHINAPVTMRSVTLMTTVFI